MPAKQSITKLVFKKSAFISVQSASISPIFTSSTPTNQLFKTIPSDSSQSTKSIPIFKTLPSILTSSIYTNQLFIKTIQCHGMR